VIPLIVVELGALTIVRLVELDVPRAVALGLTGVAWAWAGGLGALAVGVARSRATSAASELPPARARRAGWAFVAVALVGLAHQAWWISTNLEHVRPVVADSQAPDLALPEILGGGELGARYQLSAARGRIVVVDFWATWCAPCRAALPRLEGMARRADDVDVVAVALDDAAEANALFARAGYRSLKLVADDGDVSARYGVASIPHTVVIDRDGVVREVARGGGLDRIEARVAELRGMARK
jgi:thiol-disulfide isomerase/thioredoxin